MPKYIMLIGLPGSGKSTWIKNFLKNEKEKYVVISSDDIIEELGNLEGLNYKEAFSKYASIAMKEMYRRLKAAITNKANIIHDQTNLNVKSRRDKLSLLTPDYEREAIVFSVSEKELKNRLDKREKETGKHIPDQVIKSMKNSFQAPTKEEGFTKITNV